MPYNSLITRTDATSLIPTETRNQIVAGVAANNPILSLAQRLPDMSTYQTTMPVLNALPTAYFVNGDTGLKQTTEVDWSNVTITAEELAVIVPIPQVVLDDSSYDLWGQVRPLVQDAFTLAITQAVLYGTNIPASWTTALGAAGIVARSTAAGHTISLAAYTDLYEAVLGETPAGVDGLYMLVEADGFGVNGVLAHMSMKGALRNTRDANGNPIFKTAMQDSTRYELDGSPLYFPTDGSIVAANSLMVAGDWSTLMYTIRQDMSWFISDQGVITDAGGNIIYNLFQQDMVALRAVMRLGFALPNPINRMNTTAATRLPFAVLTA